MSYLSSLIDRDSQHAHSVAAIQGKDSLVQHLLLASNSSSSSKWFSTLNLEDHSFDSSVGCSTMIQVDVDIAAGRILLGRTLDRIGRLGGNLDGRIPRACVDSETGLYLGSSGAAGCHSQTAGNSVVDQSLLAALNFQFDSNLGCCRSY